MNRISLTTRLAHDAASTDAVEIALFYIEHPELGAPIRLSTDPTERISTDPLIYGTRSSWKGANVVTEPYLFVVASAELPSDLEDAPAAAAIILDNLDSTVTELLRSFTEPATVSMCVVMSHSLDLPEVEYTGMVMTSVNGAIGELSIELSRQPIEEEIVPTARFTKERFPGLFA